MQFKTVFLGVLGSFFFVTVSSQTLIQLPPIQNVKLGDNITIDCALQGQSVSATFIWYHNTGLAFVGADIKRVFIKRYKVIVTNQMSTLKITDVHSEDRGEWKCEALIGQNPDPPTAMTTLVIKSPPHWQNVTVKKDYTLSLHNSINLYCNATGDPMPTVTWTGANGAGGIILPDGTVAEYIFGNLLNLTNVTAGHHRYFCHASNGLKPSISAQFTVKVPFQPKVTVHSNTFRAPKNRTSQIGCMVSSFPQITGNNFVTWYKGSAVIQNNQDNFKYDVSPSNDGVTSISILTTPKVDNSVTGVYRCQFTNNQGSGSQTVTLEAGPYIKPDTGASTSGAPSLLGGLLHSMMLSVFILLSGKI